MLKLAICIITGCIAGSVCAENVTELVSESAEQIDVRQAQAEALASALQQALNSDQPVDAETQQQENQNSTTKALRSELLRDEDSFGNVPTTPRVQTDEISAYGPLRKRLDNSPDMAALIPLLKDFVNKFPGHRESRIALGRLLILSDAHQQALNILGPLMQPLAQDTHPDWQPWFWAGTAYLALSQSAQARKMLDIAVSKNSTIADIWIQLAVIEQEHDNHAGALQYLTIAAQLQPELAAIHLNRAYSLERLLRFEDALAAYQRFLVSDMSNGGSSLRPAVLRRINTIAQTVQPVASGRNG